MNVEGTSDSELCMKWSNGDDAAGAELLERHLPSIGRFFQNKVSDDADDLVQQTFVAAIEAHTRFRGDSSFRTYLFGIAHNVLRRHIRTRVNSRIVAEEVTARDLGPGPSTVLRVQREHRLLVEALRRIPLDYQIVFELHYWEDLSAATIAEIVGTAENTVRNRLRRGRELLDAQLKACATSSSELATTMDNLARLLAER